MMCAILRMFIFGSGISNSTRTVGRVQSVASLLVLAANKDAIDRLQHIHMLNVLTHIGMQ